MRDWCPLIRTLSSTSNAEFSLYVSTNPFVFEIALFVVRIGFILVLVHLTRRSTLPYPAAMAIAGLLGSLVPGIFASRMDPDIVLFVVLPPLLYYAAWFTSWPEFKRNVRAVSFLAFGLVFVTTLSVAAVIKLFAPPMPWAVAFVLGACVSPPDAIAATVVCRRAKVSSRLLAILEGESLMNDAAALVAFRVALAAALSGASPTAIF